MNIVLYNQQNYYCAISSESNFLSKQNGICMEITPSGNKQINTLTLELIGKNWNILWPNREGESFRASEVIGSINKYNMPEGLTLSYPATASCRTIICTDTSGQGIALLAAPDSEGKVTEFCINADDHQHVTIKIRGNNSKWYCINFDNMEDLKRKISKLMKFSEWPNLAARHNESKWQIQVGLIGPDGKTEVPKNKGFDVLVDISELMLKELGENNILHVFGYSIGHDSGYPDYTPSALLGGKEGLKNAIENIHINRQKAVFYMNGRIAQRENVEKDGLHNSVLTNNNGLPFTELYNTRNFFVMNPSSEEWQARLLKEAIQLKELGADGIQLDQLGGRAAPVPAGGIWGNGYIKLIDAIHKEGLTVWIQGLSDIYPADWFELTYRDTTILEDGTIRGGTPLGEPEKCVFQISVPNQVLLIPLSKIETKLENNTDLKNNNIIVDLDSKRGELFLYSPAYITQLKNLIHKAVLN
ncbi:MAG: hypothetical protein J7L71_06215 [Spirochaetaceae bacterium]|nr:hypothetical protein [Spirochaetaceae bacterium]